MRFPLNIKILMEIRKARLIFDVIIEEQVLMVRSWVSNIEMHSSWSIPKGHSKSCGNLETKKKFDIGLAVSVLLVIKRNINEVWCLTFWWATFPCYIIITIICCNSIFTNHIPVPYVDHPWWNSEWLASISGKQKEERRLVLFSLRNIRIKHVSSVMVWILLLGLFFPLLSGPSHVELNSFNGVITMD